MTTPLDPTRATFVSREFRYAKAEDPSVKARYPNARKIVIDTQLGESNATAYALETLEESKDHAQAYVIVIDGIRTPSDVVGDIMRFQCFFDRMGVQGRTLKLVKMTCPYGSGTTELVVRG